MSNVVTPRGPLPPRVYWRRRLVLCAVVVGLMMLIGRLFGGGDDTAPVAERGAQASAPTAAPTAAPVPGAAGPGSHSAAAERTLTPRQVARRAAARAHAAELAGPTGPLAPAAGPCAPSDVAVVPDVRDTHAYSAVPLRIGLSATGNQACTYEFGPDTVALRVTSGDDLIWETLHCAAALPQESVVVRPGWLSYVTVDWSGRRSSEGCGDGGDFAQAGYYWAEAAAIGGEPTRSQFELTTPPPEPSPTPSPTPSASETPSAQPGEEPSEEPSPSASPEGTQQPTASETTEPSPGPSPGSRQSKQATPHSRRSGG